MSQIVRQGEALDPLRVLDRLEVGPVRLEPRRMIAPYTVFRGGRSDTFEFVYRYEEDVFDPNDVQAQNLAALMGAQPALNYGLVADEIVFRGPFDAADRRFLHEMARNTAREIFVKKFLEPNPFLTEAVRNLPPVKRDSYLQARLSFPDPPMPTSGREAAPAVNRSRVAVLSSGGKESLLSYSLLNEIGREVHSIFINESGKHWFTALNAYRHFSANVPNTARVWTNSDRLFSFMLRQLPFIREDFLKQRADEYPIRLWKLAVFSFGALPLLRKRGIGRLVIGDELDTTVRKSFNGINHYDGLYDQSRFGDHAMSRYYQRKQWGLSQFSILRPLSELLIEKVLIERYSEIQRLQVSCHATHVESESVRPCGRCEKCTRVVGMLTALGADPLRCGYKQEQISGCLAQLSARGALQENAALEELGYLLAQRGLLPSGKIGKCTARERRHIIQLRFDPDRSQVTDIPVDLREPLYRVLLNHAGGAAKREERKWVDFDLLQDASLGAPFVYENVEPAEEGEAQPGRRAGFLLGELTWPEAQKRFQEVDIALLPVGAIEQHGRHLPLDTDAFDAHALCCAAAERSSDPRPLVLPLIPYGVSYHHEDFAGTISIGPETLSRLVYEVGMAVARHGIAKLVIVNGHGGNAPTLQFAAQLINRDAEIFTCVDSGETSDADVEALAETHGDVHAGEVETSTSLANRPHLVQMDKARRFVPRFSSHYLDFSSKRSVEWFARTHKISPEGVLGDPTKATREKGEKMWNLIIDHLVSLIEDLKGMSLDEIHQKSRI